MNPVLILVFNILQIIVLIVLGSSTLYFFKFSFAGLFYRQAPYPTGGRERKIAVLIPGYKEDNVIIEVANDALTQDYPHDMFDVVIIADSFKTETLAKLRELPIIVIEVGFEKSTKSKALNKAMEELGNSYDLALVLDADNLMAPDFLKKINASFENDYMAVQGHRTAKNMNTSMAVLDAVSEEITNHIFRKGHRVLGLSSAIIGSGMAFKYDYFKKIMAEATAIGGFDKEIEMKMLKAGLKIEYLDDAYVLDEKVQTSDAFSNQRRRWLSAQFYYFRINFFPAFKDLFLKGNIDYFYKAIQFIQPPRVLLLAAVFFFGVIFLVANLLISNIPFFSIMWLAIIAACVLSFIFAVPRSFYTRKTALALLSLPKGMMLMLGALLKIRGANTTFIHTQHGKINTDSK